jgi:HD-like signal output (HDOD) protein
MQCISCKSNIPDNSIFCRSCGTRVNSSASANTVKKPHEAAIKRSAIGHRTAIANPARERKEPVQLSKEERIQACLEKIILSNDLPAFSNHIHSLVNLLQSDDTSLRRLTNIIISDYSLSLEVMRKANSFFYNHSGKPICSVTHAVAMLGVDAIFHLASGLRFLDHYLRKSDGVTELLLLSSLTASHTRHLAKTVEGRRVEEACLCGLLRNLGEILVACYFREEYAKILKKMEQCNSDANEACLSILGFSFDELGKTLAKHWKLPDSIMETMDENQGKNIKESPFNALISFCHGLTNTVYRSNSGSSPQEVRALFEKYRTVLNIDHSQAAEILEAGIHDTKEAFNALKVQLNELRIERQIDFALERTKGDAEPIISNQQVEPNPKILIKQLADELESTLASNPSVEISQVILMALEAIFRGGPFDRILLCLVNPSHKEIRGRLGLGKEIESIAKCFRLQLEDRNEPLVKALLSGQDMFVSLETAPRFQESEIIRILNPKSFGLFPIFVKKLLIGAIYFDRVEPVQFAESETLQIISKLREIVCHAIEHNRIGQSGASPSAAQPIVHL